MPEMNERLSHLTDQIIAAYHDNSEDGLRQFRQLTNQASSEMTLNEWDEMATKLGYDIYSNIWNNDNSV